MSNDTLSIFVLSERTSDSNSHPTSRDISQLLYNKKESLFVHKILPQIQPSQMNQVHAYFFKILFNIIPPLMARSLKWFLHFRLSNKNIMHISCLSHVCYLPCQSHLINSS
jgi:hypothetical protein